jgi:hypothetical protein
MSNFVPCMPKSGGGCKPCGASRPAGTDLGFASRQSCMDYQKAGVWPVNCDDLCPGKVLLSENYGSAGAQRPMGCDAPPQRANCRIQPYDRLDQTWSVQKPFTL